MFVIKFLCANIMKHGYKYMNIITEHVVARNTTLLNETVEKAHTINNQNTQFIIYNMIALRCER